jgi:hypothetical protein
VLSNYSITYGSAQFTISAKPASVTPTATSKTLGAADPTFTGTLSGFLPADNVVATYTRTVGEGVGSYTISASMSPVSVLGNYNVTYNVAPFSILYAPATAACFGGAGRTILQPINADGSSVSKRGSTVPAKFRVCDAHGNSVGTPGVVTGFYIVQMINGTVTAPVNEDVASTTPDSAFRWDASGQQWIFNISTKTMSTDTTYVFNIQLNDGSAPIAFQFGLKK